MTLTLSVEYVIFLISTGGTLFGSYFILRNNWKRYGLLFLLSGLIGNILCAVFVYLGFYSFGISAFAVVTAVLTSFPFYVLLGVRYSPKPWVWKIPFYWALVHLGVLLESVNERYTNLITYEFEWDVWDTYTWWWIYLLAFEWIGGRIVPDHSRKPLAVESFRYGKLLWGLIHFILITTIFLGGVYVGYAIHP